MNMRCRAGRAGGGGIVRCARPAPGDSGAASQDEGTRHDGT